MSISLKTWTSPKTGELRVYANAFHEYGEFSAVTNGQIWLGANEDGFVKIGGFRSCFSGQYGEAATRLFRAYDMEGMLFSRLVELVETSLTKSGKFSESAYFKTIRQIA